MIGAGGNLQRHSVATVLDLADSPPTASLVAGFSILPMDAGRVLEYGEVVWRTYPSEHLDHEPADADPASAADAFAHHLRGDQIGPWIAEASLHVTDRTGGARSVRLPAG